MYVVCSENTINSSARLHYDTIRTGNFNICSKTEEPQDPNAKLANKRTKKEIDELELCLKIQHLVQ